MNIDQMRELVKECGLDWHRGFMPLFDGDETNRYAVLIEESIESSGLQAEVERLTAENAELRKTLLRYVKEVPLGNQPPMLAEAAYKQATKETP